MGLEQDIIHLAKWDYNQAMLVQSYTQNNTLKWNYII